MKKHDVLHSIPTLGVTLAIIMILRNTAVSGLDGGALVGNRYRVIISTDIGGGDEDDIQSMVHYLIYSDLFDTEAIISSPPHKGRKKDILKVIDQYEKDYPNLKTYSDKYPTPDYLRLISKQGAIKAAPAKGYRGSTEGSKWIIRCAKKKDSRPLYVLVWGAITDVAQALHNEPGIKEKTEYISLPHGTSDKMRMLSVTSTRTIRIYGLSTIIAPSGAGISAANRAAIWETNRLLTSTSRDTVRWEDILLL
jgi:hypothetical protein